MTRRVDGRARFETLAALAPRCLVCSICVAVSVLLVPCCSDDDPHRIELFANEAPQPSGSTLGSSSGQCDAVSSCSAPSPYCLSGTCVECLTDAECGARLCGGDHRCVECDVDGDCAGAKPYCARHHCVACLTLEDCDDVNKACFPADGKCEPRCSGDEECGTARPFCSAALQVCVQCIAGGDCAADKPFCDLGKCVKCQGDDDCSEATPICEAQKKECVECATAADCTAPLRCDKSKCVP